MVSWVCHRRPPRRALPPGSRPGRLPPADRGWSAHHHLSVHAPHSRPSAIATAAAVHCHRPPRRNHSHPHHPTTGSGDGFFASPPQATQAPPPAPPRPSWRRVSQRASSPLPQPPWPTRTLCHEHSYHKSRALVSIVTSPRIICYEPAVMVTPGGMAVNRVAAMPITLSEITMGDMAWVTRAAQTARGAVTPHSDAHRPTTTSTHKPHPNIEAPSQPSPRGRSATQPPQTQQEGTPALWGGLGIGFQ